MKQELRQEPFPGCFMLFAGANYYPSGGMDDLYGFGERQELQEWLTQNGNWSDWAHIVDCSTMKIVSALSNRKVRNLVNGELREHYEKFWQDQ